MIMLVAVNAGHCQGQDPGAVGLLSTEANLTVQYAKSVCDYLNAVGINTIYIHENSLSQICRIANDNDADLFISIHFNSASNKSANGTETYHYAGSQRGQIFAECVQNQLVNSMGFTDRGVKTENYYVLRNTNMTAILVEVGFISNIEEEKAMIDRADDAIRAIARGVTDAIGRLYSTDSSATSSNPQNTTKPGMASKYFSINEVSCHCCGTNGTQPILLQFLDELRERVGGPVEISCAYRCPAHNAEVGGVPNSQHVQGCACDILVPPNYTVDSLADLCFELGADACGYYYDEGFVHADLRYGRWSGSHITW